MHYAFTGVRASQAAVGMITDAGRLRAKRDEYAAAGCDDLPLFPCVSESRHVGLIAKAMLT